MPVRRRGAALEAALLDAAWEELAANGYARFTMDAVVQRAGTSPPVLYRRWSNRDELVRAAIIHVMESSRMAVPDTGSLREDLLTLLRAINATRVGLITVMNAHLAGYYRETGIKPGELLPTEREDDVDVLFDRAIDRGEADPDKLSERIRSLPFDLLRHEILVTFAPAPDAVLEEIVDTIFLPLVRPAAPSRTDQPAKTGSPSR